MKPVLTYGCLLFLILLSGKMVHAQDESEENVFTKVEMNASTDARLWKAHIEKHSRLPDSLISILPAGNYRAVVKFIIDKHGSIGQITLKEDPGHGLGQRAVKMIRNYKGKWTPASMCGRLVTAYREEIIIFKVLHTESVEIRTLNN